MNNLKTARLKAGLTQKQVAEKAGVAESQYQSYENGRIEEPKVKVANLIARILNTTSDYIWGIPDPQGSQENN